MKDMDRVLERERQREEKERQRLEDEKEKREREGRGDKTLPSYYDNENPPGTDH